MNNKPEWKDAPEWANWLSMDPTGIWFWWEEKPKKTAIGWVNIENTKCKRATTRISSADSLEERPNE